MAAKTKRRKTPPKKAPSTRDSPPGRRSLPQETPVSSTPSPPISYEDTLLHVPDSTPPTVTPPLVRLIVAEDNQAVIAVVKKGRTPALRHLHRTHRINLDWITEPCQTRTNGTQIRRNQGTRSGYGDQTCRAQEGSFIARIVRVFAHLSRRPPDDREDRQDPEDRRPRAFCWCWCSLSVP